MRALADRVRAFERATRSELVGNAQRVADGKPIDAIAQRWFRRVPTFRCRGRWRDEPKSLRITLTSCGHVLGRTHFRCAFGDGSIDACHGKLLLHFGLEMRGNQRQYVQLDSRRSASRIERTQWSICQNGMPRRLFTRQQAFLSGALPLERRRVVPRWKLWTPCAWCRPSKNPTAQHLSAAIPVLS